MGNGITSNDWVNSLKSNDIKIISMDGVGRFADNIYIERFWRTLKQEQIYINSSDNIAKLKQQIDSFIEFYNHHKTASGDALSNAFAGFCGDKTRRKELVFLEGFFEGGKSN